MKFSYKFSNLIGTVYRKGNLIFTPDGNSVVSPVGNRITIYDLKNNKAETLPVESRYNYVSVDISPNGYLLVAVNEQGDGHIISLASKTVLYKYRFKREVPCIKFSPDGKYLSVCKENKVFIFKVPGTFVGVHQPFEMLRVYHYAHDDTTFIDWTSDSKVLAVGCKDMSVKLYSFERTTNFKCYSLGSHKEPIVACFFEKSSLDLTTVSSDGQLCIWECNLDLEDLEPVEEALKKRKVTENSDSEDDVAEEVERRKDENDEEMQVESTQENEENNSKLFYKRLSRHFLCNALRKEDINVKLTAAAYHKDTHVLVTGYSTGAFFIHELPSVSLIHSLSISQHEISTIAMNNTGDWIALGSSTLGQLLVWEWQSETYVMKQQGHVNNMTCLTYSPDGLYIATGGLDGKIKLWNTDNGFSFVTFSEHTAAVTALAFSHNRKFVVSASLDGTVRAFDMARYRNFRTFTSPRPVQFSCLALDSSAEFIAAGGQDVFEIYLWSMKIGRLCEVLTGHEGPVTGLAFNPTPGSTALASVSWDKTLRLWNAVESGSDHEILQLSADGLAASYRPDGEEVAVATLDGQISFYAVRTAEQTSNIEGRNDLGSGVLDTDLVSAKKNLQGKAFTNLCYTADGSCVLAGGQSKNVCIYNVREAVLLKKFEITQNRSLDGVDDFINRRKLTEFGNVGLVEEREDGTKVSIMLPGVRQGDMSSRAFKPEIRVFALEFSPTGQAWATATTEGLLLFSLDGGLVFDPMQLEVNITPASIRETLQAGNHSKALMMAMKLGEKDLVQFVMESVPPANIQLCVSSIPSLYIVRCLKFVVQFLETSRHLEFYLQWVQHLLTLHGVALKDSKAYPVLRALKKRVVKSYDELGRICDFNQYTMQFLSKLGHAKAAQKMKMEVLLPEEEEAEDDDEEEILMSA